MAEIINRRYELEHENPSVSLCESWTALDRRSPEGDQVQIFLTRCPIAPEMIHNMLRQRADELLRLSHPNLLPLLNYGYDTAAQAYYFVFRQPPRAPTVGRVLRDIGPDLDWVLECLATSAGLLADLHTRLLAHGDLTNQDIFVERIDPDRTRVILNRVGLAGLVWTVVEHPGNSEGFGFEQAAAVDLVGLVRLTRLLITGQTSPSQTDIQTALENVPVEAQTYLRQLISDEESDRPASTIEFRRLTEQALRGTGGQEVLYYKLKPEVVRKLNELGYTSLPTITDTHDFLQKEFARGVWGRNLPSRAGDEKRYCLTTPQLRLFFLPRKGKIAAEFIEIEGANLIQAAEMLTDRDVGIQIPYRMDLWSEKRKESRINIAELLDKIEQQARQSQKDMATDEQARNRLRKWEDLLEQEKAILREISIKYSNLEVLDGECLVQVRLINPSEKIELAEDTPVRLTGENRQQQKAGYFEGLRGDVLRIGLAKGVSPHRFADRGTVTVDNVETEAIIRRQTEAFRRLRSSETTNPNLKKLLTQAESIELKIDSPENITEWFQDYLDASQKKAVRRALATRDIFLIQGPPGTGKTSVIAELVLQILKRNDQSRILLASQSNVAVNHALRKVVDLQPTLKPYAVRVGREDKAQMVEDLMLDRQLQAWTQRTIEGVYRNKNQTVDNREGMITDWIYRLEKDPSAFSLAFLNDCRVIGATCIGVAGRSDVGEMDFDWVIIDEAGRATHPEMLVPLVRGRKIVLVGDHRQLPPTIDELLDRARQNQGLTRAEVQTSLFQELMELTGAETKVPLDVQYRMHPAIGELIATCFYEGPQNLKPGKKPEDRQHGLDWIHHPILWYSTKSLPHPDSIPDGLSRRNDAEIEVILSLLDKLNNNFAKSKSGHQNIGIITGYLPQKKALLHRIEASKTQWSHIRDIEVDTVDAYQGRERDIIIYSIVRSGSEGTIGFLSDERRLNVALSRAKNLLIIVGNEDVIKVRGKNPFYLVYQFILAHKASCKLESASQ